MDTEEAKGSCFGRKLIGKPVYTSKENKMCGSIHRILIHTEPLRVVGFLLRSPNRFREERFLSPDKISKNDKKKMIIEKTRDTVKPGSRTKRHYNLIGSRVFSTDGKVLGQVRDFRFDLADGTIHEIEISDHRSDRKRSINREAILAVSAATVMVRPEGVQEKTTSEQNRDIPSEP